MGETDTQNTVWGETATSLVQDPKPPEMSATGASTTEKFRRTGAH